MTLSAHTSSLPFSLCLKAAYLWAKDIAIVFGDSLGQGRVFFSQVPGDWDVAAFEDSTIYNRAVQSQRDKDSLSPEAWVWS